MMDILQLLIGGIVGFFVFFALAIPGHLPGLRNHLKTEAGVHAKEWTWSSSEPAKFWANLVAGLCSAILFGLLIRSADYNLKAAESQRASATSLLEYRRQIHDRFSRQFMPAVIRKYKAQVLNVWLMQNYKDKEVAQLNGSSWNTSYEKYNQSLDASLDGEDPEALCALLKGLMRTDNAKGLVESLSNCVATMTSDEAMGQDRLEALRSEATTKYQQVLEEIASEVSNDIQKLDHLSGARK